MEECILLHFENNKDVFYAPLKGTNRIKYTCFEVSKSYIIYGATSGGLYIFSRSTNDYLHLIPTTEGPVTSIAVSDNEKFVAFSTKKNIVGLIELYEYGLGRSVTRSNDLSGYTITALCWSFDNNSLFIGTSVGKLAMLSFPFMNKTIFYLPAYVLMELESTIVQIDRYREFILVSTLSKCYLCDTAKNCYKQIGEKPRNGMFGACFLAIADNLVKIFSARPGSRLWEVDLNCTVHSTQEYKKALSVPPSSFVSLYESSPRIIKTDELNSNINNNNKQSLNFSKLQGVLSKYVVAFKKNANGLYIFDVEKVNVLFWTNYFVEIADVKCVNNALYIWTSKSELHKLQILSIDKCLLKLYFDGYYALCLEIIDSYQERIFDNATILTKLRPLLDMEISSDYRPNDRSKYIFSILTEKIANLDVILSLETSSGMHVVRNKHLSMQLADANDGNSDDDDNNNSSSFNNKSRNTSFAYNRANHDFTTFAEIAITYHAPCTSLTSYSIIQESLAELGTSVSEILGLNSRNVKEKFDNVISESPFRNKSDYDNVRDVADNDNEDDGPEFTVEYKSKPIIAYECNTEKIINICRAYETDNDYDDINDDDKRADLIDEIIVEYQAYRSFCNSNNSNINSNNNNINSNNNNINSNNNNINSNNNNINSNNNNNNNIHSNNNNNVMNNLTDDESFPFSNYFSKNTIDIIRNVFNNAVLKRSKFLSRYIESRRDLLIDTATIISERSYPFILYQIYNLDDLKVDFALRKLLTIFSPLLDPYVIFDDIRSLNLPCYYACFNYLLNYYTFVTNVDENIERDWPLPTFMNAMLLMLNMDQKPVFYRMGLKKNLNLRDFSYLILSIDNDNVRIDGRRNNNNNIDGSLFLEYLLKHLTRNPSEIYAIFANRSVLCHTFSELFRVSADDGRNSPDDNSCEFCNRSSRSENKYDKIGDTLILYFWTICEKVSNGKSIGKIADSKFLNVLSQLTNDRNSIEFELCYHERGCRHKLCENVFSNIVDDDNEESTNNTVLLFQCVQLIRSICRKYPNLWSYVRTLQKRNQFKMLSLEHYVQLGYSEEINRYLDDFDTAENIVNLNLRVRDGYCLNCTGFNERPLLAESFLSWNDLILDILCKFGVRDMLRFVRKVTLPESAFNKRFYRSCILSLTVEPYGLDAQKRIVTAVTNLHNASPISDYLRKQITKALVDDDANLVGDRKPKSSRHHWGLSIDMNEVVCSCCWLPLFSQRLIQEEDGGIVAFSCGHCYHTICLKHQNSSFSCRLCQL